MAKLLPPVLQGTIPAFYKGEKKALIKIPFKMNRSVSWSEVTGIKIKIKSIYHSEVLHTAIIGTSEEASVKHSYIDVENHIIYLFLVETEENKDLDKIKIGEFYKIQIAYCSGEQEGYYSTVGIIKCTAYPSLKIEKLKEENLHIINNVYTGVYSNSVDSSEKVYSYRFDIRDRNDKIVESSGDLLHNHENDESATETSDSYALKLALEENEKYTIQYSVKTVNGLEISSPKYQLMQQTTIPPELDVSLVAEADDEEGYIKISLKSSEEILGTGCFLICRSSNEDNYLTWSEMCRFSLYDDRVSNFYWRDFTVSQGFKYIYSLQQYSEKTKIYSNRILSNSAEINFEHIYLCDAERQLKIKFNPKVSSFKTTLLEQKTNTLGGQFPFFFRNGNVNYKEFSLSGLISYMADEQELFMTEKELLLENYNQKQRKSTLSRKDLTLEEMEELSQGDMLLFYQIQSEQAARKAENSDENLIANQKNRTTNLTDYNFMAERLFRNAVLDWLNNGEVKIYKSPSEGNFLVRINNVSLTPNDTLGRMIYSFSATATEIDTYNYEKLGEYGFLSLKDPEIHQLRWKTVMINELDKIKADEDGWIPIAKAHEIETLQFLDMAPGDKIKIKDYEEDEQIVEMGTTGSYSINFDKNPYQVYIHKNAHQGQITYSFYSTSFNVFDTYADIKIADLVSYQIIGETENVLDKIEDLKHKVTKYNLLRFTKRPVRQAFESSINGDIIRDELAIYQLNSGPSEEKQGLTYYQLVDNIKETNNKKEGELIKEEIEEPSYKFYIDGREFDLEKTETYCYKNLDSIPKIKLDNGIVLKVSAQRREIVYTVEENLGNKKAEVEEKRQALINILQSTAVDEENYESERIVAKVEYKQAYSEYLLAIEKALKEKEV